MHQIESTFYKIFPGVTPWTPLHAMTHDWVLSTPPTTTLAADDETLHNLWLLQMAFVKRDNFSLEIHKMYILQPKRVFISPKIGENCETQPI